jgi:hypothetical protein
MLMDEESKGGAISAVNHQLMDEESNGGAIIPP